MKPFRIKIKSLLVTASTLSIIIYSLVLVIFFDEDLNRVFKVLAKYGLIILPTSIFWWLFNEYVWCWKISQNLRTVLNIPPNIQGRWKGTLIREGEEGTHSFVLEIKQNATKVWVDTYSNRSSSKSYFCEIATDDAEHIFTLCFLWQGDGGEITQKGLPKSTFCGYTMLQIHEKNKQLIGTYFTNRDPHQTKGKIVLNWESTELLNKFN